MTLLKRIFVLALLVDLIAFLAAAAVKLLIGSTVEETDDHLRVVTLFDGVDIRPTSRRLIGGSILTAFGGTRVDFRRSHTDPAGAHFEVASLFSGTELIVPDTWQVTIDQRVVAGGVDARLADPAGIPADAPHVTIAARIILGGLRVVARPVLQMATAPAREA